MLEPINDHLQNEYRRLGLEREAILATIQNKLNQLYPNQIRAVALQHSLLKLVTASSSVAADLRMRQVEIIPQLNRVISEPYKVTKLAIQIGATPTQPRPKSS